MMLEGPPATNPWRGAPWQDLTIDKNTLECDNTDLRQQIRELTAENKVLCRRLEEERLATSQALHDRERSLTSCVEAQEFLAEQDAHHHRLEVEIADLQARREREQDDARRHDEERDRVESELRLTIIRLQSEIESFEEKVKGARKAESLKEALVKQVQQESHKADAAHKARDSEMQEKIARLEADVQGWQETGMKLRLALENKLHQVASLQGDIQHASDGHAAAAQRWAEDERRLREQIGDLTHELDKARLHERKSAELAAKLLPVNHTLDILSVCLGLCLCLCLLTYRHTHYTHTCRCLLII